MRAASHQAAASRELIHFARESPALQNGEDRFTAVRNTHYFEAAADYDEHAVRLVAAIVNHIAGRRVPAHAERLQPLHLIVGQPGKLRVVFRLRAISVLHRQNHAESRLAAHHPFVRLIDFFQREDFVHGSHAGEHTERQCVL